MHAPGCIFHITARTQGKHPWFTDALKGRVESEIMGAAAMSDTTVLAHVIMPNHFHIVLRQGTQPLAYMMHRVMHRTAFMLKRAFSMDGHVFGRRYWSGLCETAAYVRRAIIYTHLNPCRAAICPEPAGYAWSSHRHYVDSRNGNGDVVGRDQGLRFFAGALDEHPLQQYLEHLRFQMRIDAYMLGGVAPDVLVPPPACSAGDLHWDQNYAAALAIAERIMTKQPVYDVACRLLERLDSECTLDLLRTGLRAPKIVRLRRNLMAALLTAGYRTTQIARLLCVSTSTVSNVGVSLRT